MMKNEGPEARGGKKTLTELESGPCNSNNNANISLKRH